MATSTLAPTRTLRRPRRLDARAVFGLLLLLVATGGSLAFWTAASDTRAVLVATEDLPAGATLSFDNVAVARVRVGDAIYQAAIPADALASLVGRQLAEPVHAHQLLVRAQVSSRPPLGSDELALTVPVSPETAAGGRLRPGDAVQVLLTTDKGTPEVRTTVVLPRVTVYDVGYEDHLGAINTGAAGSDSADRGLIRWVTVVVSPEQAIALARAKWAGELDVALLPPQ